MKTINLLFAVHNHQPVGNWASIFRQGWQKCYEPFLRLLEKHPQFRITLHYSGSLLEWLEEEQPDFLPRLRALVDRSQVELLGGGFYEPMLNCIPEEDARGQIALLTHYLGEKLNTIPQGLWIPERIWNMTLPKLLAPMGLRYTIVDDTTFRQAGLPEEELFGYYVTEHGGAALAVFPIQKWLRYAIPFYSPQETLDALRFWSTDSGQAAAIYADDGEKFGLWPGTYRSVIEEGWLERFIHLLEQNQSWVQMLTFREYMERFTPLGRTYLPPASYEEMTAWALPAHPAIAYEDMIAELKQIRRYEKYQPYLRGGIWENFFIKYAESNHMHKKMLYVSHKVHQALRGNDSPEKAVNPPPALIALWKSQTICPYWHGLFGGIYLSHLRHRVYQNLITAERLAEISKWGGEKYLEKEVHDLDKDLHPEILVTSPELGVILKPDYGGALVELDYRPKKFNLTNVLTRRPEAYHRKLKKGSLNSSAKGLAAGGLENGLVYDWYTRYSFLDHFLGEETTFDQFRRCQYPELGDFVNQPYEIIEAMEENEAKRLGVLLRRGGGLWQKEGKTPLEIFKLFLFHQEAAKLIVKYEICNQSRQTADLWFGVELNLTLLAGDDPQRIFLFPGLRVENQQMGASGVLPTVENILLRDENVGFQVEIIVGPSAQLWRFPLETISQSERGLEKTYQGSVLLFHWRFTLSPEEVKFISFTLSCGGI